ncbi:hypothetical protein B0H10DRAFT_2216334 [Mycena sp. CBHHK59/15]|nr:hypothetical protein B0H10DRAFT_2216334 [Mycena sp. CBHHK59/15]
MDASYIPHTQIPRDARAPTSACALPNSLTPKSPLTSRPTLPATRPTSPSRPPDSPAPQSHCAHAASPAIPLCPLGPERRLPHVHLTTVVRAIPHTRRPCPTDNLSALRAHGPGLGPQTSTLAPSRPQTGMRGSVSTVRDSRTAGVCAASHALRQRGSGLGLS